MFLLLPRIQSRIKINSDSLLRSCFTNGLVCNNKVKQQEYGNLPSKSRILWKLKFDSIYITVNLVLLIVLIMTYCSQT